MRLSAAFFRRRTNAAGSRMYRWEDSYWKRCTAMMIPPKISIDTAEIVMYRITRSPVVDCRFSSRFICSSRLSNIGHLSLTEIILRSGPGWKGGRLLGDGLGYVFGIGRHSHGGRPDRVTARKSGGIPTTTERFHQINGRNQAPLQDRHRSLLVVQRDLLRCNYVEI